MARRKKRDKDGIYRRADSPFWWATWTDEGGRSTRRSTRCRIDEDPGGLKAKAVRAQWVAESDDLRRRAPILHVEPKGQTFDDLILAYLGQVSAHKRDPDRDRYSAKRLFPVFTGRLLTSLTAADARAYIAGRRAEGVQAGTINREIGLMSAALNWARLELEWIVPNPFSSRRLSEPTGRDRWLTEGEAERLVRAAREATRAPHLVDVVELILGTGLRPGEALGLSWDRVDLSAGLILFDAGAQKSGKVGSVPINEGTRAVLIRRASFRASHCPDSPWVICNRKGDRIASIKKSFAIAVRRAGLEDVHPHDLRRTVGSWLVQRGVPIHTVSTLLRHSDIRVTDRVYAHLSPDVARAAVQALEGGTFSRVKTTAKGG